MKYRCLVLDHDDTVVNSTAQIHYPSFMSVLAKIRPETKITLEEFFLENFDPGFSALCNDILCFTDVETEYQIACWQEYVHGHIPTIFAGMDRVIQHFHENGGLICVVSHSFKDNIIRDYRENGLPAPDMVFGWELPIEMRKPSSYPLEEIMLHYHLDASELLVVDDLKPGADMAKSCGVDFAAAGWAHNIPQIDSYMKRNCNYYFSSVNELECFLLD